MLTTISLTVKEVPRGGTDRKPETVNRMRRKIAERRGAFYRSLLQ